MEPFILAFFGLGYLVLGGADIGVGMLLPYLGRSPQERREVIAAIAPFFLGNEVWLIATAGVLAGLFPIVEGELLSGNYVVVVALVGSWVLRDMALWLRGRVPGRGWQLLWDGVLVAGSWGLAVSLGLVLAGTVLDMPLLAGLVIALIFALHGLAFASLRLNGTLRRRAGALLGGTGEWPAYALTTSAIAVIAVVSGLHLDLSTAGSMITPVILAIIPFLLAAQAWVWWTFRGRVTGPSYL
ncbi:MAG: cytochrome d ubiquinol oxidase subunit II [Nonomuraea sp.]|nr:cytochrome d ubiquinol oxidase subunit II [Nonomuraea sp.]